MRVLLAGIFLLGPVGYARGRWGSRVGDSAPQFDDSVYVGVHLHGSGDISRISSVL